MKEEKAIPLSATLYEPPNAQISYVVTSDVITASPETGGQWPWGEAQSINFGQ